MVISINYSSLSSSAMVCLFGQLYGHSALCCTHIFKKARGMMSPKVNVFCLFTNKHVCQWLQPTSKVTSMHEEQKDSTSISHADLHLTNMRQELCWSLSSDHFLESIIPNGCLRRPWEISSCTVFNLLGLKTAQEKIKALTGKYNISLRSDQAID